MGLQVLEGTIDEGADVPGFISRFQPNFPVGKVDYMAANTYMQLSPMVRNFVPFLVIIDRKGTIRAQYTGGDDVLKDEENQDKRLREELAKWLTPASGGGKKKK